MTKHDTAHPLAGKTVTLAPTAPDHELTAGTEFVVEDWYDRVTGQSWMVAKGNPAAIKYAMRTGFGTQPVPLNDEVLYGKVGGLGHLVHDTEIAR